MDIRNSNYHSILRICSLTTAFALLFVSGFINQTTAMLSSQTISHMANVVGMSVSVVPNEYNQITAQLTEKERQLQAREASIAEREISLGLKPGASANNQRSTYVLSAILFILLVLIILNYVLDYLQRNKSSSLLQSGGN